MAAETLVGPLSCLAPLVLTNLKSQAIISWSRGGLVIACLVVGEVTWLPFSSLWQCMHLRGLVTAPWQCVHFPPGFFHLLGLKYSLLCDISCPPWLFHPSIEGTKCWAVWGGLIPRSGASTTPKLAPSQSARSRIHQLGLWFVKVKEIYWAKTKKGMLKGGGS